MELPGIFEDVDVRSGLIKSVTVRPVRTISNYEIDPYRLQVDLANRVIQQIQRFHPTWTRGYILDHVHGNNIFIKGFVLGTDIHTQDNQVSHQSHAARRTLRAQLMDNIYLFEDELARMLTSGSVRTIMDIEWSFFPDIQDQRLGNGPAPTPQWALNKNNFKETWQPQTIMGQVINCAAFALCYALHKNNHTAQMNTIKSKARTMTIQYGWENGASPRQVLDYFTQDNPTYRLVILILGHHVYKDYALDGELFEYKAKPNGKPTPECSKKIIYLFFQHEVGSYEAHYALVQGPSKALNIVRSKFQWCANCIDFYPTVIGLPKCPKCGGNEIIAEREDRQKKLKELKSKRCRQCLKTPCSTIGGCPTKCNTCQINLKPGYNLEEGLGHRCILRRPEEKKRIWSPHSEKWGIIGPDGLCQKAQDYESCSECKDINNQPIRHENFILQPPANKLTDADYNLIVYDLESMITAIDVDDTHFVTEDHQFVHENGQFKTTTYKRSKHDVNLAICVNMFDNLECKKSYKVFMPSETSSALAQFMRYVCFELNFGKNILVAHNGSGYDSRLIYEYACKNMNQVKIKVIPRGCKYLQIQIGETIFRDSVLHLPSSLAQLAKDFQCSVMKGYFPHLFNLNEMYNQEYIGELPEEKYYDLTFSATSEAAITDFKEWYNQEATFYDRNHINFKGRLWSLKEKIVAYCLDDVKILAEVCLRYHTENFKRNNGYSPWFDATAPGYNSKALLIAISSDEALGLSDNTPENDMRRRDELDVLAKEKFWAVLEPIEYHFARCALRGGRTDVRKVLHMLSDEDIAAGKEIRYVDITSEYPYVQFKKDYPVGYPTIYIYDENHYPACKKHRNPEPDDMFRIGCPCSIAERKHYKCKMIKIIEIENQPTKEEILQDDDFFGIVCVSMTPPTNLFIPVLVTYDEIKQKCMADLLPKNAVTITTVEFKACLEAGYRLDKVHRFDKYAKRRGLWNEFIKPLYIDKMSNSDNQPNDLEKERLILEYGHQFDMAQEITDSFEKGWRKNKGLKLIAKISLNSLWGKLCQRANLPQTIHLEEDDSEGQVELLGQLYSGQIKLKSIHGVNGSTVYEHTATSKCNPNLHNGYLPAGLFVPAYGRMMLYEQMKNLGKRVLYHDTDSIIYINDPQEDFNIATSDIWGGWTEEDESKLGITAFVSIAPKSYAIKMRDGSTKLKFKGVCLKESHRKYMNFDVLVDMINAGINDISLPVDLPQRGFPFNKAKQMTFTRETLKRVEFKPCQLKGNLMKDYYVYPLGYCPGCLGDDINTRAPVAEHTCGI